MKKTLAFMLLVLSVLTSFSQSKGFYYNVMNTDTTSYPTIATAAAESTGGDFLVFTTDFSSPGIIFRFSPNGEVEKMTELSYDGENALLFELIPDPHDSSMFYGVCEMWDDAENEDGIALVHFDESLESITFTPIDLPPEVGTIRVTASMIDSYDRFFVAATHYDPYGFPLYRGLVFMIISLTGEVEKLTMTGNDFTCANTVFEFPGKAGTLGAYVSIYDQIYCFDESLDFTIRELSTGQAVLEEPDSIFNHQVFIYNIECGGLTVLPDGTFAICSAVLETWCRQGQYQPYKYDRSTALRWDDEGLEISQERTLGNNICEMPAYYKCIDYKSPKSVYTCSFNESYIESGNLINQNGAVLVMKTNQDMEKVWDKAFYLGPYVYFATSILATSDGGCLVVGRSSEDPGGWNEKMGFFVLKINEDGSLGTNEVITADRETIFAYPNPFKENITLIGEQIAEVRLYSITGQLVATKQGEGTESLTVDISDLPSGLYFVTAIGKDGRKCVQKVVKQ